MRVANKENIQDDVWEMVKYRYQAMPPNLKISIGGKKSMNKEEILEHIMERDEIGRMIVEAQMNFLRNLSNLTSNASKM